MSLQTVGARCAVAGLAGAVAGLVASLFVMWPAAILLGWDVAAICYLAWTWKIVGGLDAEGTKQHAHLEDASRPTAEATVLTAGVALLAAVGLVLVKAGQSHGGTKAYLITIGIVYFGADASALMITNEPAIGGPGNVQVTNFQTGFTAHGQLGISF